MVALAVAATLVSLTQPGIAAEISLESAPPVVVKTVPVAGTADVDSALTEIRVTYSKAMQDGSWSWSTWGEENYPQTTGEPRYQGDARTCVLPVKLQSGKFYAIWLNSDKFKNFKDVNGRPAVPYLLTFFTSEVSSGALLPPKVVSMTPVNGATNVDPALTEIKVVFDQPMMDRSWSMTGGGAHFPEGAGDVHYDAKRMTWIAPVKLKPGSRYEFGLNSTSHRNFKSEKGISLEPIGVTFTTGGGSGAMMEREVADATFLKKLNDDQRAILDWTDRQFRSFFDARTFDGWSDEERATLEKKLIDSLGGPRSTEYYQAINTLAALRSTKGLPKLREIAFDRREKDNRDRWMAIRALGIIGDKADVPELIHLVYHGNVNTRWWAQISLVRITGQNFAKDWNAWGKWWNGQNGQPPFKAEIIRWWNGQAEPDKLAESLDESDQKFLESLKIKSAAAPASASPTELAARLRKATPVMEGIREAWSATVAAIQNEDARNALASLRTLTPRIQEFRDAMKGTPLEAGTAESLKTLGPLIDALENGNLEAARSAMEPMLALGKKMEEQVKAITDVSPVTKDPFVNCRIANFGGDNSEGQQSYGGSGPAIRFKPSEVLSDARGSESVTLKGVRLYASRYGMSYSPEETKLRVILRDARDTTLAETSFAYAKFDYNAGWVDLVFDQPVRLRQPGESVTLAFDPEATQTKGIYFHYQKNPATSHSLVGTVSNGFKELADREWMVRVCFE